MYLTNCHFYHSKNYLYSKPIKGLGGCGLGYRFSGWSGVNSTNASTVSNNNGRLKTTATLTYGGNRQVINTQIGKAYTFTFKLDLATTPSVYVNARATNGSSIYTGTNLSQIFINSSGEHTLTFTATTTTTQLLFEKASGTGATYFYLDDALVYETNITTYNYFVADVVTANDYSPFGAPLAGRSYTAPNSDYRFAFNGKERDNETYGEGNAYDFGARIYDARLGRWMSLDPLFKKYPNESNYIFTTDNPILYIDKEGKDKIVSYTVMTEKGTAKFDVITKNEVMFTYIEKSDQMGNSGAGYFTFTDINQTVVLDFRTNIKPSENKTSTSEEYSGKELGIVEGGKQKVENLLGKADKFITGPGGSQPGGIAFTSSEETGSPTKFSSKSPVKVINIESLLIYAGATKFGSTSLPKIKEDIGVAEYIDVLNSAAEAKKELDKPAENGCPICGGDHSKD